MIALGSLDEGRAFMDALEAVDTRGLLIGDGEIEAFRMIFAAGCDWQRTQQDTVVAEREAALREALERVHRYTLNVAGAAEAYNEADCAHLWNEVAAIAEAALWPLTATAARQGDGEGGQ